MNMAWGAAQVALLGAAALGYGGIAARYLPAGKSVVERICTRIILGLGVIIMLTMAAGWLQLWGPWFHHGILACGILLWVGWPLRPGEPRGPLFGHRDLLWAAPLLALLFFYAAFPPTFYDALLYHLGVPGYYLQAGGFVHWPENFFSALPQNAEMLYLLLLSGGSVHGPKFLSLAAAVIIFLFLADWAGREDKARHAWLPGLIFFSIPEVVFLAATEKNDLLLMLFLLPGVRLLAGLRNAAGGWKECAACGIFLGLAGGVKWQGLFYGAAFVGAYFLTAGAPWRKRLLQVALIGLIVMLMVSPWLVKNAVMFGNPVHPYLTSLFPTANWSAGQTAQIGEGIRRGQGSGPAAMIAFILRMFLSPYSLGLTHVTGIIVLLLLPLLFFRGKSPTHVFLLVGCAGGFLLMLLAARVPRYFLPIFMVLALPLAAAWEKFAETFPRYRRGAFLLLFALAALQAVQAVALLERMTLGASYVWRKARGELPAGTRYLYMVPYYPAIEFINNGLPGNARVAFLGEDRTFYLKRRFVASSCFDRSPILDDFLASRSTAEWGERLRARGITHLLYTSQGLARLQKMSYTYRLSERQRRRLENALESRKPLFTDGRYSLYRMDW